MNNEQINKVIIGKTEEDAAKYVKSLGKFIVPVSYDGIYTLSVNDSDTEGDPNRINVYVNNGIITENAVVIPDNRRF
jgi:hypothetical protein